MMDKYEVVKDLGAGNFGVARLLRNKETKELVAMKYIERGQKVYSLFQFKFFTFVCFICFLFIIFLRFISIMFCISGNTYKVGILIGEKWKLGFKTCICAN